MNSRHLQQPVRQARVFLNPRRAFVLTNRVRNIYEGQRRHLSEFYLFELTYGYAWLKVISSAELF